MCSVCESPVRKSNMFAALLAVLSALCVVVGILLCPNAAFAASGSIQVVSSTHDSTAIYTGTMIADGDGLPIDSALDWDRLKQDARFAGLGGGADLSVAVSDVAAADSEGTFIEWLAGLVTGPATIQIACDGAAVAADDGWYLLQSPACRPLLVWVKGNAVKVGTKMDAPTLTKEADRQSIGLGDDVNYTMNALIPSTFDLYARYRLGFRDTWDEHLTYKPGTLAVTLHSNGTETDLTDQAAVTLVGNELEVEFGDLKATPARAGDSIVVTYTLTYTIPLETDRIALSNIAHLVFLEDGATPPEEVSVYTFRIKVSKTDASDKPLSGAVFALKDEAGDWLAADGSFGPKENRAEFVSDADGMVTNTPNVKAGTYVLVELKAPDGFVLPANPESKVVIAASVNGDAVDMDVQSTGSATVVSVDASAGVTLLKVINRPKTFLTGLLPKMGDAGNLLIVLGGASLIAAAVLIARRKRRKHESDCLQ